jgi:hypothetical protein
MHWSATEIIPSPVMVWRDGRGNTLVIAIVWCDNIFLNCSSVGIRKRFLDILARVFRSTNIQLKCDIVLSEGHVEYVETLTAVSALNSGPCQLIVAVDSVTAIARLRGTALMESELEARLFEIREMCQVV